jgi:hypothetical protein
MLRASIDHVGTTVSLATIADGRDRGGGILHSRELLDLAEASVTGSHNIGAARNRLRSAAGIAALNDAAAVIANFEMMTRLADTTGAGVDEARREQLLPILDELGAPSFSSTRWG